MWRSYQAGRIWRLPPVNLISRTTLYTYPAVNNTNDLLSFFDSSLEKGRTELEKATDADLLPT